MPEKMTQADLDNLADIIWWIKGFHDARTWTADSSPFGAEHIEALRKARVILLEKMEEEDAFVEYPVPLKSPFADSLELAALLSHICIRFGSFTKGWHTNSDSLHNLICAIESRLHFIETGEL